MKKVAIVGVEGSGKTVMLAGLGDLYTYPDEDGYFLAPKNFGTAAYVAEKIARMRKGEWPVATAGDEMQGLDWTLKHREPGVRKPPEMVCEVSFLDFAGEVYRAAYGISSGGDASMKEQAEELKQYVRGADDLIVLINLRDVITNGLGDKRVQEAMWITKSILDTALDEEGGRKVPRTAIVLSQADSYADTIESCGGAKGVLKKYLPYVANSYGWLDVFSANAVDKTDLDDDGNMVPAEDFTTHGLLPIMMWIHGKDISDGGHGTSARPKGHVGRVTLPGGAHVCATVTGVSIENAVEREHGKVQLWEGGPYWAETNIGAERPEGYGYYFWWGDVVGYKRENNKWVASDGSLSNSSFDRDNVPTCDKGNSALGDDGWIAEDGFLEPNHDAAHVQWGGDWRLPTRQELEDLCKKCDWTRVTMNGVNGYVVRGKSAYASANIFLPAAGLRHGTSLRHVGSHGNYWSSVPNSDSYNYAWSLYFNLGYRLMDYNYRNGGQSVRPVQG